MAILLAILLTACAPPPTRAVPEVRLGNTTTPALAAVTEGAWVSPDEPATAPGFARDPFEPVGPAAVIRAGEGLAVVDQLRHRIVRYTPAGDVVAVTPIPSAATTDAVALADGGYGLLAWEPGDDPHWTLTDIDRAGAIRRAHRVALDPPTAVLLDGDRLLVEDAHGETVDPLTGERLPGRPTGAGRYVSALREDLRHVVLTWSDAPGGDRASVRLTVDRPVVNVLALDPQGDTALVGLFLMEDTVDPALARPEIRALLVDRRGHLRREVSLPAGVGIDPLRPLALLADGSIAHLRADTTGVSLSRVAP